ncbi:MAG: conserved repeat domain [Moraxellaceae bacterium]|jgi:uncharacterized repeat protein (TIGR01451 family)|nr:conserved repeat domain [Moraxellaceae bacterium]
MTVLAAFRAFWRQACLPGQLHLVCAAVLASGLLAFAGTAMAGTIINEGSFSYTRTGVPVVVKSNTSTIISIPAPSPGVVTFYQFAPGASGSSSFAFDGGLYDNGGGFTALDTPTRTNGTPISLAAPVEVKPTRVYHTGEPVFITLADANRNTDAAVREFIDVVVTTTTGDREVLRMQETGPDTGVFAAVIQSVDPDQPNSQNNGKLSLATNTRITVNYQDPFYLTDISASAALVDPFGIVFDSSTGQPLDGATVTMRTAGGALATVYGDDGVSLFPATVVTGGSVSDSGGTLYNLPTGGFRFPFVSPGDYYFEVVPPVGYGAPSVVPTAMLPDNPATSSPYAIVAGSRGDVFTVVPGPALNIDFPVDPAAGGLFLRKQVSRADASAGDFLQYRLTLQNLVAGTAVAASVVDVLPFGLRYESGSLRVNGVAVANPQVSADGRTLTISLGNIPTATSLDITYVAQVGPGTPVGDAVNRARASANAGGLSSNAASVAVRIREALMSGQATLIGRVFEGDCSTPWDQLKGVPNTRIMLEDGTYTVTDKDGQYHFKGVKPGTHVVQLDVDSLPNGLEPVSCLENTRFAGRNFSQFVDVKGGALWRADFHTRARRGSIGIRMESTLATRETATVPPLALEIGQSNSKVRDYTVRAEFDSCRDTLKPEGEADVEALAEELSGADIQRIELVGSTDDQRLSARCQKLFRDNYALSDARARTVGDRLAAALFLRPDQVVSVGKGPDNPLASNKTEEGRARNRRTELKVFLNKAETPTQAGENAAVRKSTDVAGMSHRIELDGSTPVSKMKVTAVIPEGTAYKRGSARIDGQPADDPVLGDGVLIFPVGAGSTPGWKQVIEFDSYPLQPMTDAPVSQTRQFTLRARFDSCSASLHKDGREAVDNLVAELQRQGRVERIELIGHGDSQTLSAACRQRYADLVALSQARAQAAATLVATALGLSPQQVDARGRGAQDPIAGNDSAAGRARNRRIEVTVRFAPDLGAITQGDTAPVACPNRPYTFKATAGFVGPDNKRTQTPVVENRLACPDAAAPAESAQPAADRADSTRRVVDVTEFARIRELPAEFKERQKAREAIVDDVTAAGGKDDWFADPASDIAWLFPTPAFNPRAPSSRVVIRHLPGQVVTLRDGQGRAVDALNFEGTRLSPDRRRAVSVWRAIPLATGRNEFVAEVRDSEGAAVGELRQGVHFSGMPVRAELVPGQSVLLADGIHRPVLAVRFLDRDDRPVRAGISGPLRLSAPYRSWQEVQQEQERQIAGRQRFEPQYLVEGDEGIAYIELAPTTESGAARLEFSFRPDENLTRRQELRAWLEPQARDWVVVGFAEGTLGYNTLRDNTQALAGQVEEGGYSDGQVSLYAKGRVLGKWLLTMAYDSDKSRDRQSLLGVIDPQQFYTLYGDGTEQRYDAPSQDKLYLKLERGQFYALFGDYETGLNQTQLSRYSRSLNGFKAENAGGPVVFTAFAAETPQNFARNEIQGNGTSGLYRLTLRNIVLNSEKIRIETRNRLHSEQIVESRALTRHIDYDIDYANGTLFFRQPVPSRDTAFNPVFIVAEYETLGVAQDELNAGGRLGVNLREGKVQAGVTAIRDESNLSRSDLAGADLKLQVGAGTELRVEVAQTRGQVATLSPEGLAWLSELEHHSGRYDALVYARRQETGFGLNQQNGSESGQQKVGADGQVRFGKNWSALGQLYQQENLGSDTTRDAASTRLQYKTDKGGASIGAQVVNDRADTGALAGQDFRSEQLTASANRYFLNQKLELSAQAESALGGNSASVDYPERYLAGASYALTPKVRLLAGQEFTDGDTFDTSTTRVGFQATPWQGATLDSTVNQSQMSEYGPRTFGLFGLSQGIMLNEHWSADLSVDSSQTLGESGRRPVVVNPAYPVAPGGSLAGPGLTEDFVAVSTGATYRAPLWSWNGRAEDRNGETSDRYGLVSNFLRQAQAGVAFGSSAQLFRSEQSTGSDGWLGSLDLSWAWRPLGVQWSVLDRLEVRYEEIDNGTGITGSGLFGNNSLVARNASSRRIINNFALNRVSREWTQADREGNLFRRYERNQWSLYYGAKYALDSFDGVEYDGYTDLLGFEVRHDLRPWLDIGLQASSLNAWEQGAHAYSFGPMVGASPVTNGWITLGWNLRGFSDSDFDAARYTAQGPYLQLRFKFDQNTRLRDFEKSPRASATNQENRLK